MKKAPSNDELTLFKNNFNYYLQRWMREKEGRIQEDFIIALCEEEGKKVTQSTRNQISRYKRGEVIPTPRRLESMNTILNCNLLEGCPQKIDASYIEILYDISKSLASIDKTLKEMQRR